MRAYAGPHVEVVSAGVEPRPVDPLTVEVMREVGIDISAQRSKDVPAVLKEHFAFFVGVCDMSKERCPIFPFAYKLLKWNLEDPSAVVGSREHRLLAFRRVRDRIAGKIRRLVSDLGPELQSRLKLAS